MAQQTTCPNCRRDFQVPDALVGRAVRCPTCAATFQSDSIDNGISLTPIAPAPAPLPVAEPAEALPEVHPEPARARVARARYPRRDVEPHRGTLILVLGIIAFFILPFVLGPIAWVLGSTDLKKIRGGQMDPAGESNTNAGRICGIIATIYGIVNLLFIAVIVVMAIVMSARAPAVPMPPTAPVRPAPPFQSPRAPRPPFPKPPPINDPSDPLDSHLSPSPRWGRVAAGVPFAETRPWPGR